MSSGRPSTSLARLSRALPISSFAFLPVGWDPAVPPWAPGAQGSAQPPCRSSSPGPYLRGGSCWGCPRPGSWRPARPGPPPGPWGWWRCGPGKPSCGEAAGQGAPGPGGDTGQGGASPLGRIAPRVRRLRTGSHRRRQRPRPPPWHREHTCGRPRGHQAAALPAPPRRRDQSAPSLLPSITAPTNQLPPSSLPHAMTPGPPSNPFCPGWAVANQLPLILAAHTAPAHWPVDPEPAARPMGCRRDPSSSSSSRRQGPRPGRALTLSRRSLLLPARPILARCHRAGRKGQARGGAHFRRAPGAALPGEGGREPPRRCPSSRWRRQPRAVPPAPSCAGSADPPPRWR